MKDISHIFQLTSNFRETVAIKPFHLYKIPSQLVVCIFLLSIVANVEKKEKIPSGCGIPSFISLQTSSLRDIDYRQGD